MAHAAQVTFSDLPVPPKPAVTPEFTARGKFLYDQNCSACHGVKGDAKADAVAFLLPKPRNFVEARFRLRSTPSGNLPTDVDLYRAVSLGMPGTPMPPWKQHVRSLQWTAATVMILVATLIVFDRTRFINSVVFTVLSAIGGNPEPALAKL